MSTTQQQQKHINKQGEIFRESYENPKFFEVEEIQEVIVYDETQEEANERERHEEDVRVANLTMTALDFIGILQQFGLTLIQINEYLENHLELKTQLTYCQNVYCGVVQALCPLTAYGITITKEMVIHAFKVKNGEE